MNKIHLKEIKGDEYLALFRQFIADTGKGNRLKKNGRKISSETVDTYIYTYKLLAEFSEEKNHQLKLYTTYNITQLQNERIKKYYKGFYKEFT